MIAAEQKARETYENILCFADDTDVKEPLRFLREREIVHFQRFGESNRHFEIGLERCENVACNNQLKNRWWAEFMKTHHVAYISSGFQINISLVRII